MRALDSVIASRYYLYMVARNGRNQAQEIKITTYTATIQHDSIRSARRIEIKGSLDAAKRAATREFGRDFVDYVIAIQIDRGDHYETVASRRIGDRRWNAH